MTDGTTAPGADRKAEPLRPGEDPVAQDLGNIELANSAGMQNTVAVVGLGALIVFPISWALARLAAYSAAAGSMVRRASRMLASRSKSPRCGPIHSSTS